MTKWITKSGLKLYKKFSKGLIQSEQDFPVPFGSKQPPQILKQLALTRTLFNILILIIFIFHSILKLTP